MNKVFSFFNEVLGEIKKISWPQKNELIGSVIVVCILTVIFAIILGGMDLCFSTLIKNLIF